MEFIDTHTHCYDEAFAGIEDEIISRAASAGVSLMLQADIDSHERGRMLELTARHPERLRHMLGLYPGSVREDWRDELDAVEAAYDGKAVAVGEIGLDYHYGAEFAEQQKEALRAQLELAASWDLPVNIHLRDATGDFVEIIEDCRALHLRGNLHAYGGSYETFRRLSRYHGLGRSLLDGLRRFNGLWLRDALFDILFLRYRLRLREYYLLRDVFLYQAVSCLKLRSGLIGEDYRIIAILHSVCRA